MHKFTKEVWPNGLRAIYVPMTGTQTVTLLVLVGTGSRYETKDINGISHFLEHMFFKGTVKRPGKSDIAHELDAVGAAYNAFTDKELTGYWVKVDSKHADLAFDVVSDIFLNSTIPAQEIEKERGVIIGEIDMYEDTPMRKIGDLFEELLYGDQPAGWDIAGRKEVIRSLQRQDFLDYLSRYYKSENVTVAVAGNIDLGEAKAKVEKYFKQVREGQTEKPLPCQETQSQPQIKVAYKDTDQCHLVIGARAYNMFDPRRWALGLLATILGGGMSSRLFIRIRDELGLGYYIRASSSLSTDHGYFDVSAGVDTARIHEAAEAIMAELRKIKENGVAEKELQKAKDYIKGGTLLGLESSDEVASFFGLQEVLTRDVLTVEQKFSMMDKVSPADIKEVAEDIFQDKNLNLAVIGPLKDRDKFEEILKF
ncbi:MAG: insulinase family protein [Parcubacteria group bacterium]|nr:insulinase family protein [Parcubacteria group bacterium]